MKNTQTLILLSALLLTFSCKKKDATATATAAAAAAGATAASTKTILSAWNYTTTDQTNFSFSSNYTGSPFSSYWTSGLGGARNDCECTTTLSGTSSAGVIVLISCIDFTSRVTTAQCTTLLHTFDSGTCTYSVNASSVLTLINNASVAYKGSWN